MLIFERPKVRSSDACCSRSGCFLKPKKLRLKGLRLKLSCWFSDLEKGFLLPQIERSWTWVFLLIEPTGFFLHIYTAMILDRLLSSWCLVRVAGVFLICFFLGVCRIRRSLVCLCRWVETRYMSSVSHFLFFGVPFCMMKESEFIILFFVPSILMSVVECYSKECSLLTRVNWMRCHMCVVIAKMSS